jgi:hypothetical protein
MIGRLNTNFLCCHQWRPYCLLGAVDARNVEAMSQLHICHQPAISDTSSLPSFFCALWSFPHIEVLVVSCLAWRLFILEILWIKHAQTQASSFSRTIHRNKKYTKFYICQQKYFCKKIVLVSSSIILIFDEVFITINKSML